MLDKDELYMKIVAFDEIYNFVVLSFSFEDAKMLKKLIIKFQDHNIHVQVLVALEK
jgi:hypothetical protein